MSEPLSVTVGRLRSEARLRAASKRAARAKAAKAAAARALGTERVTIAASRRAAEQVGVVHGDAHPLRAEPANRRHTPLRRTVLRVQFAPRVRVVHDPAVGPPSLTPSASRRSARCLTSARHCTRRSSRAHDGVCARATREWRRTPRPSHKHRPLGVRCSRRSSVRRLSLGIGRRRSRSRSRSATPPRARALRKRSAPSRSRPSRSAAGRARARRHARAPPTRRVDSFSLLSPNARRAAETGRAIARAVASTSAVTISSTAPSLASSPPSFPAPALPLPLFVLLNRPHPSRSARVCPSDDRTRALLYEMTRTNPMNPT